MRWTDTQLSYFAGIIDGEGCFNIGCRGKKTYTLRLFVMNTSKPLIDYLHTNFGGWKYSRQRENKKWKIRHEWFVDRQVIDEILPLIHPFLIVKKEACEVAMDFRKTFPKVRTYHKIPDEVLCIREDCHHRMQILNKKGP